ncbi:MAG: ATP-binding protein [Alphaproteobacteria bacterium]|nr:ATP-binding protein [Alphaproteobacteria bacterium]
MKKEYLFKEAIKVDPSLEYRRVTKKDLLQILKGEVPEVKTNKNVHSEIAVFPNRDKTFHESWDQNRKILNIPHPFRCMLVGPPNCGKTSMILNILMHNRPYFEEVIVVHCDPKYTKEYNDIPVTMLDKIPAPSEWEGKKKTLVILDDLEFKQMNKEQKRNLNRLFGFVSTHKNISVCLSSQDTFNTPASVRRCANLWVLWKIDDLDSIRCLSRKIRMPAKTISELFRKHVHNNHDCIMIDNTNKSPFRVRRNGVEAVPIPNEDH